MIGKFSKDDEEVKEVKEDMYCQGSFAIRTGIKPTKQNSEFDVDMVLVLNLDEWSEEEKKPRAVLEWLAERLRADKQWKGKVTQKNRCIRISYAGDFHLDIIPAIIYHLDTVVEIPDKEEDKWKPSNPKGYIKWFKSIDPDATNKLIDTAKLFKYWRDKKFGEVTKPKSILLTTLVAQHYARGYSSLSETFTVTHENLRDWLHLHPITPQVSNPSEYMSYEDLARHWTDKTYRLFKERVEWAAGKAREALDEENSEKSRKLWKEIFPDFPQDISEDAKAVNEARKAGRLFTDTSGGIVVTSGGRNLNRVENHVFFGDKMQ